MSNLPKEVRSMIVSFADSEVMEKKLRCVNHIRSICKNKLLTGVWLTRGFRTRDIFGNPSLRDIMWTNLIKYCKNPPIHFGVTEEQLLALPCYVCGTP